MLLFEVPELQSLRTVTGRAPDLLRKHSSSVSLISRNNKQVFHFRTLLTACKVWIVKWFCPLQLAHKTISHSQKKQAEKEDQENR